MVLENRFETDPAHDVPTQTDPIFRYLVLYQEESGIDWIEETLRANGKFGLPGRYLESEVRAVNEHRLAPEAQLPLEWSAASLASYIGLIERHRTPEGGYFGLCVSLTDVARIARIDPNAVRFQRFDAILMLRRSDRLACAIDHALRRAPGVRGRQRVAGAYMDANRFFPWVASLIGEQARSENLALGRVNRGGAPILELCWEDLVKQTQLSLDAIAELFHQRGTGAMVRLQPQSPVPQWPRAVQEFRASIKRRFLAYACGEQDFLPKLALKQPAAVGGSSLPHVEAIVERFGQCRTTADFYRMQIDQENLATPEELLALRSEQSRLPGPARQWIREISVKMLGRDTIAQPFRRSVISEGITLFSDQRGDKREKALLLVFCGKIPRPFMPTAMFLQALPAQKCDVALLSDRGAFLNGMFGYAADMVELATKLRRDLNLSAYASFSCAGISAASAGAVATGLMVGARNATSLGGRPPIEILGEKPIGGLDPDVINRSFCELGQQNSGVKIKLVYGEGHEKDRLGALELKNIFEGELLPIENISEHNIFFELKKIGKLRSFLWKTLVL